MFRILKQFKFEAAHRLTKVPEGHKCSQLHGHSYTVQVILESDVLDDRGFVRDYGELSVIKEFLNNNFDHKYLNEVMPYEPTAELIAFYLFEQFKPSFPELSMVAVSETENTSAVYCYTRPPSVGKLPQDEIDWLRKMGEKIESVGGEE